MKTFLFLSPLVVMFIFISGCRPARLVVRERPMEPHYVQPLAPGPGYIWHNGEWIRHRNTYVYHKGFWIKVPANNRYYAAGHWQRIRSGWVWIRGYWH